MDKRKIDFDLIDWEYPIDNLRLKKFKSENKQIRIVEYNKEFVEPDWCLKGHIGYVIEGEIEIDFNGVVIYYKPGDVIFIDAGENDKHKAKIITDNAKVILIEDI